jgi:hypothetical protein
MGSASSRVGKIGIYRNGNDIKMGVIPRYEESPAVLFMFILIICGTSGDPSPDSYRDQGDDCSD